MLRWLIAALVFAQPLFADSVVPTRTIRANAIIQNTDVGLKKLNRPGDFSRLEDVVGQEARVALYPGRPVRVGDIGPPAVIVRNQIVRLEFAGFGLHIVTEGRALERGGAGDIIRLMNLNSRATLFGQIQPNGTIRVTQ